MKTDFKRGHPIELIPGFTFTLIKHNDFKDIIDMLKSPKVAEFLFFAPAPEALYRAYFYPIIENTAQAIEKGEWPTNVTGIIHDKNGHFMGICGLHTVVFLAGNYELGFQFTEKAWGQGLASHSGRFMLSLAFESLEAHKVVADCYRSNTGSYKALLRSGLREEGSQTAYYKTAKGYDDRLLYGITKTQFDAL